MALLFQQAQRDSGRLSAGWQAGRSAPPRPIVIGDLPFGSYQVSDEEAIRNAIRFVKEGGADVVKLEGAGPMLPRVRAIIEAGIQSSVLPSDRASSSIPRRSHGCVRESSRLWVV